MNTFSVRVVENQHGAYINETEWDPEMEITYDLVEDSPYIERVHIPEARPMIEFNIKNGHAMYEIIKFDPVTDCYTLKLLTGEVY